LNNLIYNNDNEVHFLFVPLCAFLLFSGAIAKSVQFPLHVWLPDAMEEVIRGKIDGEKKTDWHGPLLQL